MHTDFNFHFQRSKKRSCPIFTHVIYYDVFSYLGVKYNSCRVSRTSLYCPFRGCAGDWVKLGVAKRHGAVLGDAVSKMADENTKVQLVESDIPGAELPKPA